MREEEKRGTEGQSRSCHLWPDDILFHSSLCCAVREVHSAQDRSTESEEGSGEVLTHSPARGASALDGPHTHPLKKFALQEGLDDIVGGGEVPRLVDEVDGFEPGWEGVLW